MNVISHADRARLIYTRDAISKSNPVCVEQPPPHDVTDWCRYVIGSRQRVNDFRSVRYDRHSSLEISAYGSAGQTFGRSQLNHFKSQIRNVTWNHCCLILIWNQHHWKFPWPLCRYKRKKPSVL